MVLTPSSLRFCILRQLAALDAFPSGSYAEHNGSRETLVNCYKDQLFG